MAKTLSGVDDLRDYLAGVMARAEHHADGVSDVALALAGAIIWRMDGDQVAVFERNGKTANVLWAVIGGSRYAFSYNHDARSIEMRHGSTQGPVVHAFTNRTSNAEIRELFRGL